MPPPKLGPTNGVKFGQRSEAFNNVLTKVLNAGVTKANTGIVTALRKSLEGHLKMYVENLTFSVTEGGSLRLSDGTTPIFQYDLASLFQTYVERYEDEDPHLAAKYQAVMDDLRMVKNVGKLNRILSSNPGVTDV